MAHARYVNMQARKLAEFHAANPDKDPVIALELIPRSMHVFAGAALVDGGGTVIRGHLKLMRNKVAAGAIRRAALCPQPDGSNLYRWTDETARLTAVLGIVLVNTARSATKQAREQLREKERARFGAGLVKGIPQVAFLCALRNPWTRERPTRTALGGTHRRGAAWHSGDVGWLRRLEGAGLFHRQRMHIDDPRCEPVERMGRHSTNRYWIVSAIPTQPLDDAEKFELLQLHDEGWQLARSSRLPSFGAELAPHASVPTAQPPPD